MALAQSSEVENLDDVAVASPVLIWRVCLQIGWYQSIEISAHICMDVRKRMEMVSLLFDHYTMSFDKKHSQIRHATMVDG